MNTSCSVCMHKNVCKHIDDRLESIAATEAVNAKNDGHKIYYGCEHFMCHPGNGIFGGGSSASE